MSQNRCFVIMPYGGSDPERRRHFLGVYEAIIRPAAEMAGLVVDRADIAAAPGSITKDIIQKLYEYELVIADLTDGNANVYFELGIRHSFYKAATVHLIEKDKKRPFDVQDYRAIEYTTDLAEIPKTIQLIVEAIKKRMTNPLLSDNPVHDHIPGLPVNLLSLSRDALGKEAIELRDRIVKLEEENSQLRLSLPNKGDVIVNNKEDIVNNLFLEAAQRRQTSPRTIIIELFGFVESGDVDSFLSRLKESLVKVRFSENHYTTIALACGRLGLSEFALAVLKMGCIQYPRSIYLAKPYVVECFNSADQSTQIEAVQMLESMLGIEIVDGKRRYVNLRPVDIDDFGILFDYYINNDMHDSVLDIIDSFEPSALESASVLRAKARALFGKNQISAAKDVFEQAIALEPNDELSLFAYGFFLDEIGQHRDALHCMEKNLINDFDNMSSFTSVGIQIMNRKIVKDSNGEFKSGISVKDAVAICLPFIIYYMSKGNDVGRLLELIVKYDAKVVQRIVAGEDVSDVVDESYFSYVRSISDGSKDRPIH